ncbi:MAG: L,D-transpeptidase family protein [Carboxylicivirga sp.]|jgi:murein L,D-transpeptidase YcbB/YkuD|nr:L,D-transpeptidase family protein [Carboxylicivirga sp.]
MQKLIVGIGLLVVCAGFAKSESSPTHELFLKHNNIIHNTSSNKYLFRIIDDLNENASLKLKGQKIYSNKNLIEVYQHNNYQLLWQSQQNRHTLLSIIEAVYFEGLNPLDYHLDFIRNHVTRYRSKPTRSHSLAVSDIIMTDALLTCAHHLAYGKVHAESKSPRWHDSLTVKTDTLHLSLSKYLSGDSLKQWFQAFPPKQLIYREFKELFARYDSIHKKGGQLDELVYPGFALKIGDTITEVSALKTHLVANAYSSLEINEAFDLQLEEAVKDFQLLNGIEADGIVGEKTYKALNITIAERLDILRVNMERMRWLIKKLPSEYILVNIASFYLHLVNNDSINYYCRVVVGKDHKQTPTFSSQISYLVFNPNWHIPRSIVMEEILPKLPDDKNYLQDRNMILWRGTSPVDPTNINFSKYSTNNFPFTITQKPGIRNALGKVKFMFPNPYMVYLHDTPSKSLFNRSERAFSHGCIRVENPLYLAQLLINDEQNYNMEKIVEIVATKETKTVFLQQRMPLIIIYMTCDDNKADGRISFYKDIYGKDQLVLEALYNGR